MHLDVLDLRNFYYRTKLGRIAQRAIRDRLVDLWPDVKGQTVVGFGFAAPLLRPFLPEARRVIALMPAQQGVMPWPAGMPNVSVLCEETQWPLDTGSVDRLVLLHGFETSEQPSALLEETARVLGPGGRALFIVPSRSGLWARRDGTPFGYGRPYTLGQLEAQLRRHEFQPERSMAALFSPPSGRQFWLRTADFLEKKGRRFAPWLAGGVLMVEVSKQMHSPRRGGLGAAVTRPLRVLEGVGQAIPTPSAGPGGGTTAAQPIRLAQAATPGTSPHGRPGCGRAKG
ncbi:class I SAM-dependent methyltransferase [Szabonella alba]|uniref:Methyltransferase domain-containing protein n=1 Tax=Szabonella alba TaxID=2804194 RepID=A0A8K0VBM4_9RHOB|nr:class I SAM-dependent methyltransferase [Szabonella alba]MBL4918938.1 methyltransferase domain-containing protein [Szabonella alba]